MFQAQPELFDAGSQILYRNNLSWHLLQCTPSMMTALPTERERSEALRKESHRGWWDLWICKPVNWLFTESGIFELVSFFVTGFLMNQNELFVASIHGPGLSHCRVPKGPNLMWWMKHLSWFCAFFGAQNAAKQKIAMVSRELAQFFFCVKYETLLNEQRFTSLQHLCKSPVLWKLCLP